jgi:tetratricopeptide (TPR) repeat protein
LIAESLALRRELRECHGIADSLSNLGFVVLHQGDFAEARQYYSEALSINRELDNQQGIADALRHLALMAFYEGDHGSAQAMNESSLAIWRGLGDQQGIAWALHRLGYVKLQQGAYTAARDLFRESLAISNDIGFKWGLHFPWKGSPPLRRVPGKPGGRSFWLQAPLRFDKPSGSLSAPWLKPSLKNFSRLHGRCSLERP